MLGEELFCEPQALRDDQNPDAGKDEKLKLLWVIGRYSVDMGRCTMVVRSASAMVG
jgi:hypothetical protein